MEGFPKVITIVCTGNVCRSPMAERLLAHALRAQPEPLASIQVLSAGLAAAHGEPASHNASLALKPVKLSLDTHRSQPFSESLMRRSDLILAMTTGHLESIRQRFPEGCPPLYRFREWMPTGSQEVPDPYGGPLDLYIETRDALAEAIPSILAFLKTSTFST